MKKLLLAGLTVLLFGCSSSKGFFDTGNVTISDRVVVPIVYNYKLPICPVTINGKQYHFLLDTGAPTVISEALFSELKLKKSHSSIVRDSQKKSGLQKFARLPELKIGDLVFTDIGAVVMTLQREFKCFGVDGIIGANLMATAVFEFDLKNSEIKIGRDLTSFDAASADFAIDFTPVASKTPMVKGKIMDQNYVFTFDTGFTGNLKVSTDFNEFKLKSPEEKFVEVNGVNSIGAYGTNKPSKNFMVKSTFSMGGHEFHNETVDSGALNLIGNEFLENYVFAIDWIGKKIYFKNNESTKEKEAAGFGFAYLFVEGKAVVVSRVEDHEIPVQLGDEVLSINGISLEYLNEDDQCKYFTSRVEEGKDKIDVKVMRDKKIHEFQMQKKVFIP